MKPELINLLFFGIGLMVFLIGVIIYTVSKTTMLTRAIIVLIFLIITIIIIFAGPDIYLFFKHGGFNGLD